MLQRHWRLVCLTIFVLATPAALFPQDSQYEGSAETHDLAIIGATLIDGNGGAPRSGTTIVVQEGRIVAVTPDGDAEVPPGATKIDANGKYVVPGLADMHVHFSLGLPLPAWRTKPTSCSPGSSTTGSPRSSPSERAMPARS